MIASVASISSAASTAKYGRVLLPARKWSATAIVARCVRVVADVGLPQPVRDIVDREGRSVIEPDRIQGPTVSPGAAFAENVEVTVRADDTGV